MNLLFFFALIIMVVNGDVLFYPSSIALNGTDRLIETDPYCVSTPIQFNGSSSLFPGNTTIWVKQRNYFEATGTFQRVRPDYASYLTNPTVVPYNPTLGGLFYWVFPCQQGDTIGWVTTFQHIPNSGSPGITTTCEIKAPIVFACMGNVPSTQSPSVNPSKNPSQPTPLPSRSPSLNPTHQPTRIPTSSGDCNCVSQLCWVALGAVMGWLSGANKI